MTSFLLALCLLQDPLDATLDALLPKLAAESLEERTTAAAALIAAVRGDPARARPILRRRLKEAADEQVKTGLRAALDALPKVELRLTAKTGLKAGEVGGLQAWVRNCTDAEIVVPLPVAPSEAGFRHPSIAARILDPRGTDAIRLAQIWDGTVPAPDPEDFVKLAPGAEVDLLASPRVQLREVKSWKPSAAGAWRVRLSFDWTPADPNAWIGPQYVSGRLDAAIPGLIAAVPREKLEAEIEVPVAEK